MNWSRSRGRRRGRSTRQGDHVGKVSPGLVHDFKIAGHLSLGVGGLYSLNFVPRGLEDEYDGRNPRGAIGFLWLKIE